MNKHFILCALIALFCLSCSKKDEPTQSKLITFHVTGFEQSSEPLDAPRRVVILDDEGGSALTDIYAFDGSTQIAHQTSDQENFGTLTLELTNGEHNLSFVATRSAGLAYDAGVLTCTSLRPTFGKMVSLNVSSTTPSQNLTLDRITGVLDITLNDAFPSTAAEIEFKIDKRYDALDVTSLCGTNGVVSTLRVSCSSKVGLAGESYKINFFAPSLEDEYLADVTITVYNAGGTAIYGVTIEDVRMAANTKTLLSGDLFITPQTSLSVDHTWNADIVGTF